MKQFRVLMHSLVWSMINIGSVMVAFLLGHLIEGKRSHHAEIQLLGGPLISTAGIVLWSVGIERLLARMRLFSVKEIVWTYGMSLVCGFVLFTGVHYLTQGYLTSLANIIAVFFFQVWVNLFAAILLSLKLPRMPIARS